MKYLFVVIGAAVSHASALNNVVNIDGLTRHQECTEQAKIMKHICAKDFTNLHDIFKEVEWVGDDAVFSD